MTRLVSINRLAEAELRDAITYYEQQLPGLGRRLLFAVESALTAVVDRPLAARRCNGTYGENRWTVFRVSFCTGSATTTFGFLP